MHLISKAWILFFRVSKQGPDFTAVEEGGGVKRLVELEFACKELHVYVYLKLTKDHPSFELTFGLNFYHHHLSHNRDGRWGTTDDLATSFLHFSLSIS